MTDWTAERLDALPDSTVIETTYRGKPILSARIADGMTSGMWVDLEERGDCVSSRRIWVDADPGSIRVVSVPVDALLSELPEPEAYHPSLTGNDIWEFQGWNNAVEAMRAAIAHVTGEA